MGIKGFGLTPVGNGGQCTAFIGEKLIKVCRRGKGGDSPRNDVAWKAQNRSVFLLFMPNSQTIIIYFYKSVSLSAPLIKPAPTNREIWLRRATHRECDAMSPTSATDVVLLCFGHCAKQFFIAKKLHIQISMIVPHFLFLFFAVIRYR